MNVSSVSVWCALLGMTGAEISLLPMATLCSGMGKRG